MASRDELFLRHMLAAMERVQELTGRTSRTAFEDHWVLQNALMRELEVLGEAAGRVSPEYVKAHSEIPWREITGVRHKLIHHYFEVDLRIVWRTATINVPEVLPILRAALAEVTE
jgi:uncharacterized protein with HEPN domain